MYDPLTTNFLSPDSIVPQPGNPVDWNRFAYVRGNPVKYRDPTGHAGCVDLYCEDLINPVTGELIGNKEFTKSFFGFESVNKRSIPPNPTLSILLSVFGVMADATALAVSAPGAAAEVGGFAKGFAEGTAARNPLIGLGLGIVEAGAANAIYQKTADEFGDTLGYVGFFATAGSDYYGGNSYFAFDEIEGQVFIIGPSTQTSFVLASAGKFCPIAICDATIDFVALSNDILSFTGNIGPFRPLSDQFSPRRLNLPDWLFDNSINNYLPDVHPPEPPN